MAKYKVLKRFRNKETKEVHEVTKDDDSIELTVKRADEIAAKLGDSYLERIEGVPTEEEKAAAAEADKKAKGAKK